MVDKKIGNTTIRLVRGDITDLQIEAFVYYAEPSLKLGSGFGNAIATRGGPSVQAELKGFGTLKVGEAVVTEAGEMKAKFIIHAVGPRFQEADTEAKVRTSTSNSLKRAEEKGIKQIAFPPMGCGFYGVPPDVSARAMLVAIKEHVEKKSAIKDVAIVVRDTRDFGPFEKALNALP
jgi:O-acetyl-ADP-ribose deacetylase